MRCSKGCGGQASAYRVTGNLIEPLCLPCLRPEKVMQVQGLRELLEDIRKED